ncbi:hypothetical protein [Peptoniphilus asaccharolyticus]|nr:hypothetical protein [Peptoniphilus asaccharolyticus]MBL7575406.1 hypothetical protein [Peptoniphilus asaccharolyticus]
MKNKHYLNKMKNYDSLRNNGLNDERLLKLDKNIKKDEIGIYVEDMERLCNYNTLSIILNKMTSGVSLEKTLELNHKMYDVKAKLNI